MGQRGAAPRQAAAPQRRVPGMPPVDGGSKGGKGRGKVNDGGQKGFDVGLPVDQRLFAPGVLDGGRRVGHGGPAADDDEDDDYPTWATVARRGARSATQAGSGAKGGSSGQGSGQRPPPAPAPSELPPPRKFVPPAAPRQLLARKVLAHAGKIERLQAAGANPARLQRATEEHERMEEQLRLAGGATGKSLCFALKAEEEKIEKASRQIDSALDAKQEKIAAIERLNNELASADELIARLRERKQAAIERRAFLAKQKYAESQSEEYIQRLKGVANGLTGLSHEQVAAAAVEAKDLLQELIDAMAPPAMEVDIADGDSVSDVATATEGSDATSPEVECSVRGSEHKDEGRYADQLAAARARLDELESGKQQALHRAEARRERAPKRTADGRVVTDDLDGDTEMVPPLAPEQVDILYHDRLAAARLEVEHLEGMASRESVVVPPTPILAGPAGPPSANRTAGGVTPRSRRSRAPSPRRAPTPLACARLREGADALLEETRAGAAEQRRQDELRAEIAYQERLQARQEMEFEQMSRAKEHGKSIEANIMARVAKERAPTPELAPPRPVGGEHRGDPPRRRAEPPQQPVRGLGNQLAPTRSKSVDHPMQLATGMLTRIAVRDQRTEEAARERSPRPRAGNRAENQ